MRYLDLSLERPEENLALDEALLDFCEESGSGEILRLWEPTDYFVVLGYSNKIAKEVNVPYCAARNIPVLRRISGGGTVLQGPGCLNYSLILDMQREPALRSIKKANSFIMEKNCAALSSVLGREAAVEGITDLTLDHRKFSGNAQRRRQRYLLFHGTFLAGFDLTVIEGTLQMPPVQPDYRKNRRHLDFVSNISVPKDSIKDALRKVWNANGPVESVPLERVRGLVEEKYSRREFIEKF